MIGITVKSHIGVGDGVQFTSLPENYYRATGSRLVDVSRPWFFDHNPFVLRGDTYQPKKTVELWNFGPKQYDWPRIRDSVYLSNAELHASVFNVPVVLNRPRLYAFEDVPFFEREQILLHIDGRSHGVMPDHVIQHVIQKYGSTRKLVQVGLGGPNLGLPRVKTESLWELAQVISRCRMFIGVDSGPGWIACCYPDVVTKIIRTKPSHDVLRTWIPLEIGNIHSHWDDRCRQVYNTSEQDIGFTYSYRKL